MFSRSARLGHSRVDAGWTSSDQIRVVVGRRNPNGRWMTEQNRTVSGVMQGWVGPAARFAAFLGLRRTDGRGRMREATLHRNIVGWFNEPVKISASCIATRKSVGRKGGRERGNARAEVGERSVDWYVGLSPSRGKQTGLLSVGCCPPQVESECLTRDERGSALLRRSR